MGNNREHDPNHSNQQETVLTFNPFVVTCGAFTPGEADRFLSEIGDPVKRLVGEAELAYYRGKPEKSSAISSELKECSDPDAIVASFLIDVVSALSLGNTDLIFELLQRLETASPLLESTPQLRQSVDFFLLYFNILTHNREEMRFPEVSVNAFAVPEALLPIAIYGYAHYLILCGDYGRAIGLAEGMLIQMRRRMPVSEIFLSIIISVGYICRSEWEKAEYYFRHAWEIAAPDRLFMPFAEHKAMLSGMLEKCVKNTDPEAYKTIAGLFAAFHKNWVQVHNSLTGEHVTDKLTGTEMNVAMLASRGLSNQEIAEFLNVSVNSVRSHLRNIFNKLSITNRKELGDYIIK